MQDGPIKQTLLAIRSESEQNLKDVRHSFITTPLRIIAALISQASPPHEPFTWLSLLKLSAWITGNLLLTLASLGVIYGMATCLIAIANLSKNGYRLRRPPRDQVMAIAQLLCIIHVTVVFTLATLFGFDSELEVPVTYAVLLAYSLGSIAMLFVVVVFGGTFCVALWKMLKGTLGRMRWPGERELAGGGEKSGLVGGDEGVRVHRNDDHDGTTADNETILVDAAAVDDDTTTEQVDEVAVDTDAR